MEKVDKKTGKHKNPNSLANLTPGGKKKGSRTRITKNFVESMTDYLEKDLENFLAQVESLSTRDQVMVKMKLMDMVVPKNRIVTNTQETEVDFTINVASNVLAAQKAQVSIPSIQEAEVIELKNEDND
ncbi:MAG: hypothetical protein EOO61_01285 [Hymenobacter sp.]|nr:MAG: hypothetical protein EOO61_01285 [Hymenobacter sp.]